MTLALNIDDLRTLSRIMDLQDEVIAFLRVQIAGLEEEKDKLKKELGEYSVLPKAYYCRLPDKDGKPSLPYVTLQRPEDPSIPAIPLYEKRSS